jgi:hypothetical protein
MNHSDRRGFGALIQNILKGYYLKGRSLLSLVFFTLGSLALSAGIVYPLWYFAVNDSRAYTRFCLILLICGLALVDH